jgi:hypothetical protein
VTVLVPILARLLGAGSALQLGGGRPGRVELELPERAGSWSVVPHTSLLALGLAFALIAGAWWVWRCSRPSDPAEAAFLAISRGLRLSRAERHLIRELSAAHGRATPTALLLSEHALKEAVQTAQGIEDSLRIDRLVRKLDEATGRLAA